MPTLQELRDTRATTWTQAQDYLARSQGDTPLSAEDEAAWTRALAEVDTLTGQIESRETHEKIDKRFADIDETVDSGELGGGGGDPAAERAYRDVFMRWAAFGMGELNTEQRELLRKGYSNDPTLRAQGEGFGAAGGYTVPTGFWAKVTETMKYFGGAADGAEAITTDSGNPLPWPTNDDTGNVGYQLGENVQAVGEGDLAFGQKELGNYTYASGPILAALALIQDSGIDIEAFIARKMGQRIGRIQNTRFTNGTGTSQPQGYITGATTGVTTAGATAIIYDELVDLVHSVDAAYRMGGACRWKFHDLTLAYIRKIKDTQGHPLWEPSLQAGVPDLFLGYPYTINNDMDTIAATKKTVAFGDFASGFVIRKVTGGQMKRLEERYADFLQVGFIGFERADSIVQDASAYKVLVQHS